MISILLPFMKLYLVMSVVLLASWMIFTVSRSFHRALSPALRVRTARSLVAASILLPPGLSLIPAQKIPVVQFVIFSSEGAKEFLFETKSLTNEKGAALEIANEQPRAGTSSSNFQALARLVQNASFDSLAMIFLGALIVGWFYAFAKLRKDYQSLRGILNRSIPVRKVGRTQISVSEEVCVPFSTLLNRIAFVVIPTSMALDPLDYKLAIFHELQHHRCRDTIWAKWIEILVAVWFWNPAARLWKQEIIELQELACDETLIGQRRVSLRQYGNCLLKVAEAALGHHHMQTGTVCMAVVSKNKNRHASFLRRRIDMFASYQGPKRKKALGLVLGTVSLLVTSAVAYGAQQTLAPRHPSQETLAPNPGDLQFDPIVQKDTEKILSKYLKKFNAKAGFVLVSDIQSGRLLAVANISDNSKDKRNWSLSYQLEPASAMKIPLIATALDEGSTTVDETHDCANGKLKLGNGTYHDWKPFDQLTTAETAVHSSNICSIRIAQKLGADGVAKSISDFGFGSGGTTTDFPQASAGDVPNPAGFDPNDYLASAAIGASGNPPIHVTALEILQAFAAIGNDGKLMKPIPISAPDSSIQMIRQAISKRTAIEMKAMLRKVVLDGTGQPARSQLYTTAGKTSSAFAPTSKEHHLNGGERSMAGFAGFAPALNPKLAVYVGVFDPNEPGDPNPHGSKHAAPVFKEVIEKVLPKLGVAPDQIR